MANSYLARFVKVIENEGGKFVGRNAEGRLLLAEYRDQHFDPPVVLDFDDDEFLAGLEVMGDSGQFLWPEVSALEGAYRLALVHVVESVDTLDHPPSRMHFTTGGLWVY
jgi:hypothetical protein